MCFSGCESIFCSMLIEFSDVNIVRNTPRTAITIDALVSQLLIQSSCRSKRAIKLFFYLKSDFLS